LQVTKTVHSTQRGLLSDPKKNKYFQLGQWGLKTSGGDPSPWQFPHWHCFHLCFRWM